MKEKPTIIYVIDNLGRGGAETLLAGILPDIAQHYNILLVTLTAKCEFDEEELQHCKRISLGFKGKLSYISCVVRLRKIFKQYRPAVIHAHLTLSSQVARLANRGMFPLVYSIHSVLSANVFDKSRVLKKMEQFLFSPSAALITVSSVVLDDYSLHVGRSKNAYVVNNYIGDHFFNEQVNASIYSGKGPLKLVAVGNLKSVKNYEYLLKAFTQLDAEKISLDIYGKGDEAYTHTLQNMIRQNNISVSLKGPVAGVQSILADYHFFVMPSRHEGFGIAAIEAMAMGLPLLLSDIPVFRNITYGNALFFNPGDTGSFVKIIQQIENDPPDLLALAVKGKEIARKYYARQIHVQQLLSIYNKISST